MQKVIITISSLCILVWIINLFIYPHPTWDIWVLRDEIVLLTGMTSFAFMSLIMFLAIRPKSLENIFNGLDKMYFIHKWAGIISISLGGLHYFIDYIGPNFLESIFGDHHKEHIPIRELAGTIGEYAFWGIVILAALSLWNKFSYHLWIYSHKLMSVAYLGIAFHAIILTPVHYWLQPAGIFILLCCTIGVISCIISLFGLIGSKNKFKGRIININKLDDQTIEITCRLKGDWKHKAGQYAFFQHGKTEKAHPFTISSADTGKNEIKLSIKALGDYTKKLQNNVKIDDEVCIEGPYGKFDFTAADNKQQIWIGGGIGITPFISWLESLPNHLDNEQYKIDFYYCINNEQDAVFSKQLKRLCNSLPNVKLNLYYSDEEGFLTIKKLQLNKNSSGNYTPIFFCGPKLFAQTLKNGLKENNIPTHILHKEFFTMR